MRSGEISLLIVDISTDRYMLRDRNYLGRSVLPQRVLEVEAAKYCLEKEAFFSALWCQRAARSRFSVSRTCPTRSDECDGLFGRRLGGGCLLVKHSAFVQWTLSDRSFVVLRISEVFSWKFLQAPSFAYRLRVLLQPDEFLLRTVLFLFWSLFL